MKNLLSILIVLIMSVSLTYGNSDDGKEKVNKKKQEVITENDDVFEKIAETNELTVLAQTNEVSNLFSINARFYF